MIKFKQKGNFSKAARYLGHIQKPIKTSILNKYAEEGVKALKSSTPVKTGKTAESWYYEVTNRKGVATISFCNSNIQNGVLIAIILQYGHGTPGGSYISGINYIDPAIRPLFKNIEAACWKEVTDP